jgi:hypothetical protein
MHLRSWSLASNRLGMVAVSKPDKFGMRDEHAAPHATKSNLPSAKQVVQRPKADAEYFRCRLLVVKEPLN